MDSLRGLTEKQRDLLTKSEEELYRTFNPGILGLLGLLGLTGLYIYI